MVHLLLGVAAGVAALTGAVNVVRTIALGGKVSKYTISVELRKVAPNEDQFVVKKFDRNQNKVLVTGVKSGKSYEFSGNGISSDIQVGNHFKPEDELARRMAENVPPERRRKLSDL